jgi:hypothetical protein
MQARAAGCCSDGRVKRAGHERSLIHVSPTALTMTTAVDALEREGLLTRRPAPTDRRATLVVLIPSWAAVTSRSGRPSIDSSATTSWPHSARTRGAS